jgi:hypothetical protein
MNMSFELLNEYEKKEGLEEEQDFCGCNLFYIIYQFLFL